MTVKPDSSSPFGIHIWMTKNDMDKMCLDELRNSKKYLPKTPGPINIERFIESHLQVPIEYRNLEKGYLGCADFGSNGKPRRVILASSLLEEKTSSERRLRSTLAHEAGHCIFHPMLFMQGNPQSDFFDQDVDKGNRRILCRDVNNVEERRFDGRWWEYQANRAIGGFLLPKSLVEMALTDFLTKSHITGTPSLADSSRDQAIQFVADAFDVNPVVAKIRLAEMYDSNGQQMTF